MNEGAGRIVSDLCNKSKPAAMVGATTWAAGSLGGDCIALDGATGSTVNTQATIGAIPFSISLWYRHDAAAIDILFSEKSALEIGMLYSSTNTEWDYQNANFTGVNAKLAAWDYTRDAAWHHMVLVEPFTGGVGGDAINALLYIDGILKAQGGTEAATNPASSNLTLGGRLGGTVPWQGALDNVRLYKNRVLTHSEVLDLYNFPFAGLYVPRRHVRAATAGATGKPWHYYSQMRRAA